MASQLIELQGRSLQPSGVPAGVLDLFIRRLSALCPLQMHEAAAIAGLVRDVSRVSPHTTILEDGIPANEALILLSGLACHYKVLDTARRQMTGFVLPGDFCDYGFLSSSPVRQCVMTLGPTVMGRIDLKQLSALGDKLPNIVLAMMRGASAEQACARELVISLGARDAQQRMAHCLCELYTRLRVVGLVDRGQFELALTQAELGEALGLSTVHVNRTIQQLRKKKLVAMAQGKVRILDFPSLARIAAFDGRYLRS
ncbi:Crp/Fnr family transcriptional regulator [Devosia sp.]|uniref:Crp/Fnr family transcriptional regulator n=1 Tax=Devosia sp. TaxID=1871048 RepID=UPI0027351858|nr:Crp/Fnr family transcriptional regulator [Devosia sp.]MDP2782725.1 Crp/Fnr family transcriptional regulator [Devosia sp.]